jgi:tetratricopeptide (TPR) repeat protein
MVRLGAAFGLAVAIWAAVRVPSFAQEHAEWVGKRVVQKDAKLTLRVNDEPIENDGQALRIYRVEQADGASLLLKSESDRASGWVSDRDVIAVDLALKYFSQKAQDSPKNPFVFAMLGALRHDKGEHALAIRHFDEAIRIAPKSATSFVGRAQSWYSTREFDKAIADFDVALGLDPRNAAGYVGRGLTRVARNQLTLAIADFSEAIWVDPLSSAGYDGRGRAWQAKGEYAKAIIDFNMVLRLDPQQAATFRRRGACWEAEKKYGKAVADLNEAIRIDPNDAAAYRALAQLLAACPDGGIRDARLAIDAAKKACELTQWKETASLDTLAAACAAAGEFEEAVKWQIKSNGLSRSPGDQKDGEARLNRYREKLP